jgi:alcohol dehydrogenase
MNLSAGFVFTCPFKTNSGNKALEHLPVELAGLNAFRPLVVASAGAEGQKAVRILMSAFGDSGMTRGLFDGVTETADLGLVDHLKNICLEKKYDAVIALGGGKAADVGKVLNLAVSLKTPDARQLSPEAAVRGRLLPLVVVPTAGADGLETSCFAHLGRKVFSSEYLVPVLTILDPRLARAKKRITMAATGLAALGRAVESHIGEDRNPFREAYSFAAIRFVTENLPAAVADPGNKKAGLAVLNAAAMSGCAFSNSAAGRLHRLGQVFYDLLGIPQGVIMGMCMPHVLRDDLARGGCDLSALLHPLAGDDAFARTPAGKRAEAALDVLDGFLEDLRVALAKDLPRSLEEAGVSGYRKEEVLDVLGTDEEGLYLRGVVERIANGRPERKG